MPAFWPSNVVSVEDGSYELLSRAAPSSKLEKITTGIGPPDQNEARLALALAETELQVAPDLLHRAFIEQDMKAADKSASPVRRSSSGHRWKIGQQRAARFRGRPQFARLGEYRCSGSTAGRNLVDCRIDADAALHPLNRAELFRREADAVTRRLIRRRSESCETIMLTNRRSTRRLAFRILRLRKASRDYEMAP